MMGLGQKIKEILKEKNKTIADLADISGVPKNTLYAITKRDSKNIRQETLVKISNALDVNPMELLEVDTKEEAIEKAFNYGRELKLSIFEKLSDLELTENEMEDILNYLNYIEFKREESLN